ncbi:MAG TPA: outer membrane protein transport protein [Vicinamibacterales bacterium]|nr:outer membrane protein transport protein [Vicinamibacterales bacterium]
MLGLVCCFMLLAAPAAAQGHLLHGVGPVNSSMGGAGVAVPIEAVGALHENPALIAKAKGNQVTFASEFFKDGLRVESRAGTRTAATDGTLQMGVIPAFGWMAREADSNVAIGFGLLGTAGFRTDYPQDSNNVLLLPQPDGFGRIYTDLLITKIPVAFAMEINPQLAVGASLNLYRGALAISPLPVTDPDLVNGIGHLPSAGNQVASWGFGLQVGLLYEFSPMINIGASFTTPQKFQQYEWNSTVANPQSGDFGKARTLTFNLDGPATFTFGAGLKPNDQTQVAIDLRYVIYDGVAGIGEAGGVDTVNHKLIGIGWRNIWAMMAGVQYQMSDMLALRAGFNWAQTPIREELTVTSMGTPATFQKHFTAGAGVKMNDHVGFDIGFYLVPRETVSGPILSLYQGVIPDSQIDMSNKITAMLVALNFGF